MNSYKYYMNVVNEYLSIDINAIDIYSLHL